ncbi:MULTISPECIES: NlpC/P60 family protein [unclassified Streptomyces]|uniref:NlpC/P60 family protein n=1 Tax=unclassified Streptomyces TaxID=2593676 RepID=UPI000DD98DAB|nr:MULTISPECIES: NlpC/P60 family protein [unclassified Streptomyces]QZZ29235.1 C40 family peptidase [Streptomyces sp. ST1015]
MTEPTRRGLLTAFAATAAAVPLVGSTTVPARAVGTSGAVPLGPASPRSSVTFAALDASYFTPVTFGAALTATALPGTPERTEVSAGGRRVAVLTRGARTVVLKGPPRTFLENKRPFVDDFQRTLPDLSLPEGSRSYWGTSPGGGSWSTTGPVDADFSVTPGTGLVALTTENVSRHASLRDGEVADVDVRSTVRLDKVPAGQACSYALSFGYQDARNHYRARLSFLSTGVVQLRVEKEVADVVTSLAPAADLATGVSAHTDWTVRVRRESDRIRVKAWRTASAEPSAWAVDVADTTFAKGRVGLRALANTGCTNLPVTVQVSRFQVDAANWASSPSVTHDEWVRLLPSPYDGDWTPELERTVRELSGSLAPDALAYAAMFLGGAPAVTAGSGQAAGRQVLGEAGYGYLDSRGYRYEGADFHEYMDTDWTFGDGSYAGRFSKQAGNLDCSGYTRMVYGYHLGVPLAAGTDTSGLRLPRKSRDMATHSPGTVIARTDGTSPPSAELLQPGDLVLFNADSGDDTTSTAVDHVGIYLGLDTAGKRRFLSSRKTANGPTMSDLGGASLLDGAGTYARTLHTVHRI